MPCKISQTEDYLLTYEHIFNCYKTITNYYSSSLNITRNLTYYKSITISQSQIWNITKLLQMKYFCNNM
nr:MAG TPA: hypothetical protein [Caudoviricetes sp.]